VAVVIQGARREPFPEGPEVLPHLVDIEGRKLGLLLIEVALELSIGVEPLPHLVEAPALRWSGYLSSTGVYGYHGGGWVDEDTPPRPGSDRSRRRLAAEEEWHQFAERCAVDIFRLAGIYGPGRSPFDSVRAGLSGIQC